MLRLNNGITGLMKAASSGDYQAFMEELADGADVNATDIFGNTPLAYAAMGGHDRIVRALLMMNADAGAVNMIGLTPGALAASRGHQQAAELLGHIFKEDVRAPLASLTHDNGWLARDELSRAFSVWRGQS